ncbi:hypothetical protein WL03_12030 [Burkholderia ubonensis]|uniref:hypothetical protein n=1 Tax=Burkholderia ubonensis TaxID=101571 RepID=UPI000760585E|nr:hypothetical protein [Burkholderia ubonensis]KVX18528.1 hypothetical protein WL03_12030 [Burkholderia ubonensis]
MSDDLPKRIRQAVKDGRLPNMRDPRHLGYFPPAAGFAHARFVGYFELGTHEEEFEGKKRDSDKVDLVFELSGPNHEPTVRDGWAIPVRITVQETLSTERRSYFTALFNAMNYTGSATHMAELLGAAFIAEVFHRKSRDGKRVYATLRGAGGYRIAAPAIPDEKTGMYTPVQVDPAITAFRMFVWDIADIDDWHSIYIPGEYPELRDERTGELIRAARPMNVIQEKIMSAKNWKEHPLAVVGPGGYPNPPTDDEMWAEVEEMKQMELAHTRALVSWLAELNVKHGPAVN